MHEIQAEYVLLYLAKAVSVHTYGVHMYSDVTGYTDDTCQYIRASIPKTMMADLKDSIKSGRSINVQDKYGATAVSHEYGWAQQLTSTLV